MSAKDTGSALLDLRLFGQAEVRVRGLDITGRLSKRAQWLMAILALREGRPIERHRLAGMIWPESTDAAALFNLRQTLASLRKELGEAKGCLQAVSPRSVVLPLSADVRVDVTEFDGCCKTGRPDALARALDLYKQPLLIDCDEPFALTAREARTQAFLLAADQLAGQYVERGEYSSAARVLQRVLAEDPYRETSCRALMSALADSGDASAALELCREFRLRLRRDLNSEISQETKSLYRRIRAEILKPRGLVARDRRIPIPLTGLVGRQPEIRQVISMLNRCRLVTLTGPGGVGKTRLSLAVAEAQANLYLDGAHFVDLAPLTDPDTISSTVAGVGAST